MFMQIAAALFAGMFVSPPIGATPIHIPTAMPTESGFQCLPTKQPLRRHLYFDCTDSSKRAPERSVR